MSFGDVCAVQHPPKHHPLGTVIGHDPQGEMTYRIGCSCGWSGVEQEFLTIAALAYARHENHMGMRVVR